MDKVKVSEASIKNVCESYLNLMQLQKRLIWHRLNSGDIIIGEEGNRRRVKCCPKGTADCIVILPATGYDGQRVARVIYCEYKSSTGKQAREQRAFELSVTEQGHQYWIVQDAEGFIETLNEVM